jgi:hypothetical protein
LVDGGIGVNDGVPIEGVDGDSGVTVVGGTMVEDGAATAGLGVSGTAGVGAA